MKKKITIQGSGKLAAAMLLCAVFTVGAKADCGFPGNPFARNSRLSAAWPELSSQQASPTTPVPDDTSAAAQQQPQEAAEPSMVGLWNVTFVAGGQVVDQGFDQWNSGGTEILNDTPPPSTGNVCLGVWAKTGPNTYKLKHPSWTFDPAGNLTGTAIIREQVTLDARGKTFKGPVTVDVFDLNGNLLFHLDAVVTGQRITVD
jgi:hypothetical protein